MFKKVLKHGKPELKRWNFQVFLFFSFLIFFFTFGFLILSLYSSKGAFFVFSVISFYLSKFSKKQVEEDVKGCLIEPILLFVYVAFFKLLWSSSIWLVCIHITHFVIADFLHPLKLIFLLQIYAWFTLRKEKYVFTIGDLPLIIGGTRWLLQSKEVNLWSAILAYRLSGWRDRFSWRQMRWLAVGVMKPVPPRTQSKF